VSGKPWSLAEVELLLARYPNIPTHALAAEMGRTEKQIYMKAFGLGLNKSSEYMRGPASGRIRPGSNIVGASRFRNGHSTWNKGMKGWQPDNHGSRFQKGVMSKAHLEHTRPVGSERIDREGYLERKVSNVGIKRADWKRVNHLVWEEYNGSIPPGHIVVFRDRKKNNIAIENLELITREENMKRNTVHRLPKELALAIQAKGALQRQINKRIGR